jgi:hypothetical protein
LFGAGGAAGKAAPSAKPRLLLSGSDHDNLEPKGKTVMSTTGVVQPTAPLGGLTAAQQNVDTVENDIMKYLTPGSQVVAALASALGPMAPTNPVANAFNTVGMLTKVAQTLPGDVGTYASLAALIEQVVAGGIGTFENATTPTAATIVANAHPRLIVKWFHPNIAKQEEAAAAALAAAKPAA